MYMPNGNGLLPVFTLSAVPVIGSMTLLDVLDGVKVGTAMYRSPEYK
tara:strand:+ start:1139 stop:1279 length:141 start_codon:yes stop_codon:yes gene_type:complete